MTHIDPANDISREEVLAFLKKRQGILDGVCITGGEPLLSPDLETFMDKVKEMGYLIKTGYQRKQCEPSEISCGPETD